MPRLILFSGGVESTALLTIARKGDFALVARDVTLGGDQTARMQMCMEIAARLNVGLETAEIGISRQRAHWREGYVHQLWWIGAIVSFWLANDPTIDGVLYGLESTPLNEASADAWGRVNAGLQAMHGINLVAPLRHLSKREQWDMIPASVRPYVRNCTFGNDCGRCSKCDALRALPGSFLCGQPRISKTLD